MDWSLPNKAPITTAAASLAHRYVPGLWKNIERSVHYFNVLLLRCPLLANLWGFSGITWPYLLQVEGERLLRFECQGVIECDVQIRRTLSSLSYAINITRHAQAPLIMCPHVPKYRCETFACFIPWPTFYMLLSISFPKLFDGEVMFVRTCLCVFVCLSGSFIMRTLRAGPAEFDGCKVLYSLTLYVIFHSVSLVPRGAITISNQKKEKKLHAS